jgi:ribosomal protein L32
MENQNIIVNCSKCGRELLPHYYCNNCDKPESSDGESRQAEKLVSKIFGDMKEKAEKEKLNRIIVLRENVWQSWLKDGMTFGLLFLMFWLNHKYIDGSGVIDWIIALFFIITLIGHRAKEERTIDEAITYLQEMKAKNSC